MAKIFITGATGYIGGEVLQVLHESRPEYSIRALVRDSSSKAEAITKVYGSNVQVVEGSLDDTDIIAHEAAAADIVLHLAATHHLKSVQAIHKALSSKPKGGKPTYWIQISGASALAAAELADKSYLPGSPSDIIFDDLDGVSQLRDHIRKHPARAVDNYVLSVAEKAEEAHMKTALVIPPLIYGEGRGKVNRRSVQLPDLVKATLQWGRGLQVGEGLSRWGTVHIQDLGQLFLQLVERADHGGEDDDNPWNLNGFYLTGIGEVTFADLSQRVATEAARKGLIASNEVDKLIGEYVGVLPHGTVLYGTNARSKSRRGKEVLGWTPERETALDAEIARAIDSEAQALGLA